MADGSGSSTASNVSHVEGDVGDGCEEQEEEGDAGKEKFLGCFIVTSFDFH